MNKNEDALLPEQWQQEEDLFAPKPEVPFAPPGGSGTGVTAEEEKEVPKAPVRGVSGGGAVKGTDPFLLGFEKEGW